MEEPRGRRRRPLLAVLGLGVAASLLLVGWTWWWAGSSPITVSYPDFNSPEIFWSALPSTPGSVTAGVGGVVGLTVRLASDAFDARADRVYVALERRVVAFDARTGSAHWFRAVDNAKGPVSANYGEYAGGAADYETFVGTGTDTLRTFNDTATGDPTIRDLSLGARVHDLAAYVGDLVGGRTDRDLVLAATEGGELVAVEAVNHTILWRTSFASRVRLAEQRNSITRVPLYAAAFSEDGTRAFVSTEAGEAFALDTRTGAVLFSFPTGIVSSAPLAFQVPETRVLIGQQDGFLSIFGESGLLLGGASVTDGPMAHMVISGSGAIVVSVSGEVVGVTFGTGGLTPSVSWSARLAGGPAGPATVDPSQGFVLVADSSGRVTGFRFDGSLLFRIKVCDSVTAGPETWTPVSALSPLIWVGCADGSVYALRYRPQSVP